MSENLFLKQTGVKYPIICGAMYPCSNPELIAAVAEAGAMAIIQPISLTYVYKYEFRKGIQYIRSLTKNPIGLNVLVEKLSKTYEDKNKAWVDAALDEGVRFFITALGNPDWVVKKVHARGGIVYHDVTDLKWASIAAKANVDGFICVNNRAGGHAGAKSPEELVKEIGDLGKPIICAGGVGTPERAREMLDLGYSGVQMGTRFIATKESKAHDDYKNAILNAKASDIVLTNKLSGVPVSIIKTPYIEKIGVKVGPIGSYFLRHPKTKHYMRMLLQIQSVWKLKHSSLKGTAYKDYFQAGKSVEGINSILSAADIVSDYGRAMLK